MSDFSDIYLFLKKCSITNVTSFCWEVNVLQLNKISSCWELWYFRTFKFFPNSVNSSLMLFLWTWEVVAGYVLKVADFWAYAWGNNLLVLLQHWFFHMKCLIWIQESWLWVFCLFFYLEAILASYLQTFIVNGVDA